MERLRRFFKSSWLVPFLVLFALLFFYFAGVSLDYGDDGIYALQAAEMGPLAMALQFRQTWSARLVIEAICFSLYLLPSFVWKVINCLMVVLLAYSFVKLLGARGDRRMAWLACGAVCVYPLAEMISAGWAVTCCNYLWPLALGVYALTPWVDRLAGRTVRLHSKILSVLALAYAANADQMLAILVGFTIVFFVAMVRGKLRFGAYEAVWVLALCAMAVLYLTAPGPGLRIAEESARFQSTYGDVGVLGRLYNVFMVTNWYVLFHRGLPLLLLSLVVCLAVFAESECAVRRSVACFPLAFGLAAGPLFPMAVALFPGLGNLQGYSVDYPMQFASGTSAIVPFALFCLFWGCLAAGVVFAAGKAALPVLLVLAAGLCSQLVMFLAPSAIISYQRYTIYLQMALVLAALRLFAAARRGGHTRAVAGAAGAVMAGGNLISLYLSW